MQRDNEKKTNWRFNTILFVNMLCRQWRRKPTTYTNINVSNGGTEVEEPLLIFSRVLGIFNVTNQINLFEFDVVEIFTSRDETIY